MKQWELSGSIVWALALCLLSLPALAQSPYTLRLLPTDTDSATLAREIDWPARTYADTASLREALATVLEELRARAYWEASVDTLLHRDNDFTALLHRGARYRWAELTPAPNVPQGWLSRAGFRGRLYTNRDLRYEQWETLRDRLALEAATAGYPFARVFLDSLEWARGDGLAARIVVERGPLITLAGLEYPETARIGALYLEQYTGLRPGEPYNEDKIRRLRDRLRELPFLQLRGDPTVRFTGEQATVVLPLERRRASRFDFIIGVLPNSNQTGRLLITGNLNGELYNGFGRGERIAARFEQLRPQTQELELEFAYPYVLGLPFGLDVRANLYRRDTQFIDLGWRAAAAYLWEGGSTAEVFWTRQQTNLLGFDTARIARSGQLPDTLDVSRSSFGLALTRRQLDYRFNPRQGWSIFVTASAGAKRIRRNNRLLAVEGVPELYDSLLERSGQFRVEGRLEGFLPVFSRATLHGAFDGGAILGRAPVLVNEQYRLGGSQRLRGFDEQSVFASRFAIATIEYRYLLGQNSYFYTFGDFAYLDRRSQGRLVGPGAADWPLGFGAGITFETRAGIFGLSLAFGRQNRQPVDFGAPKVHFGYVSLF